MYNYETDIPKQYQHYIKSLKIGLLKQYRKYVRSLKIVLLLIKDEYLNIILKEIDNNYFMGNNYFLEVNDVAEIYAYYKDDYPIIFVENEKILYNINEHIEKNTIIDNNLPNNVLNYHIALLIDANKFEYRFNETDKYIPNIYELGENVYFDDDYNFFFYGKNKKNVLSNKITLFPGGCGYGDIIMALPIVQYFINNSIYFVEILHTSKKTYEICSMYLKNCKNVLLSSNILYDMYKNSYRVQSEYKELYVLFTYDNSIKTQCHYIEYICSKLHINPNINDVLKDFVIDDLPASDEYKQFFNKIKNSGKYIITTQFYTSNDSNRRSLTKEFAREFVRLCQMNRICVIQLEPNPYNINYDIDLSDHSITDIIKLMKNVDIHVGIDSCFGHTSALLGIPSLTIWSGGENPLSSDNGLLCSYRPLRRNYSIFTEKDSDVVKISPQVVFNKLLDILYGKITLQNRFLNYEDSLLNVDCYNVGSMGE